MLNRNTALGEFAFPIVTLIGIICFGCRTRDPEPVQPSTRDLLIGTWQNSVDGKTNVVTYHADGSVGGRFETGSWGILTPTVVLMSGNWTLDGRTIKYTVTHSSHMNEQLSGQVMTDTIISINETAAVLRDETGGGKISTWIRKN